MMKLPLLPQKLTKTLAPALLAVALALTLGSCTRIQPVRTLPSWVRRVYIPMVENKSAEPGLEELITRVTQEEFLADGRLDVVHKRDADLEIRATIQDYFVRIEETDSDDIPDRESINMLAELRLVDPYNPETPIADLGVIQTYFYYYSDPRSRFYETEPAAKEKAITDLARQIVAKTITGFPVELDNLPPGAKLPSVREPGPAATRDLFRNRTAFPD